MRILLVGKAKKRERSFLPEWLVRMLYHAIMSTLREFRSVTGMHEQSPRFAMTKDPNAHRLKLLPSPLQTEMFAAGNATTYGGTIPSEQSVRSSQTAMGSGLLNSIDHVLRARRGLLALGFHWSDLESRMLISRIFHRMMNPIPRSLVFDGGPGRFSGET